MSNYYTIVDSSRRITQYIKQEAYKWLLKKLEEDGYAYNKCKEGADLANTMVYRRQITDEDYERFLSYFESNPYVYIMGNKKAKRSNKITTNKIENYFIQYNDAVLPIGFIIEFFEDDYEFGEGKELIREFLKDTKIKMKAECKYRMHERINQAEEIQERYPCIFRTHLKLILTNTFRALIPIYMIILFTTFFKEIHLIEVVKYFINECQFDVNEPINISKTISAYILYPSNYLIPGFDFMDYIEQYGIAIIFNIIFFFVIIKFTVRALSLIYYFVRNIIFRITFAMYIRNANYLNDNGVEEIVDVIADDNNMDSIVDNGEIVDEIFASIPKAGHKYNAILSYDIYNTGIGDEEPILCGRLENKILSMINSKYGKFRKYNLYYDPEDYGSNSLNSNRKKCGKGIVSTIIFVVLMSVLNHPGLFYMVVDMLREVPALKDLDIFK